MNRTTFLRKLHQRADTILEMIQRSDKRAQDAARYIITAKTNPEAWHGITVPLYEKELDKYIKVSYRLQRYYADVMVRLTKPVIERMAEVKPIADIKTVKPLSEDHILQILNFNS